MIKNVGFLCQPNGILFVVCLCCEITRFMKKDEGLYAQFVKFQDFSQIFIDVYYTLRQSLVLEFGSVDFSFIPLCSFNSAKNLER